MHPKPKIEREYHTSHNNNCSLLALGNQTVAAWRVLRVNFRRSLNMQAGENTHRRLIYPEDAQEGLLSSDLNDLELLAKALLSSTHSVSWTCLVYVHVAVILWKRISILFPITAFQRSDIWNSQKSTYSDFTT